MAEGWADWVRGHMVRVKSLEASQGQRLLEKRGSGGGLFATGGVGARPLPYRGCMTVRAGQRHAQRSGGRGSHPWLS